jgi:hypothetical protein
MSEIVHFVQKSSHRSKRFERLEQLERFELNASVSLWRLSGSRRACKARA